MKRFTSLFLLSAFACIGIGTTPSLTSDEIDLSKFEQRMYSQNGEDGVTIEIFNNIGVVSNSYVEFGTQSAAECDTRAFLAQGWSGLLMDGGFEDASINLKKEFVTAENIVSLFQKYDIEREFDLLSIDIDFNDFHVLKAILKEYTPRVVITEYNATHLPDEDKVIVYDAKGGWDGTNYFGASILSFYRLGRANGYSLVYAENAGVNLFFIRDDIIQSLAESGTTFKNINNVDAIYRLPRYGWGPNGGHTADPYERPYVSAEDILSLEITN